MRRMIAIILSLCLVLTCLPALAVTTPTDLETPPVETPPAETETPPAETESPAPPAETETPAPPAETETPAPPAETETPAPATETPIPATETPAGPTVDPDQQEGPYCDVPGCAHVGQDVFGLPIPLCARGEWLLDRQELESANLALRGVAAVDLSIANATLWRSGNYDVAGGASRPNAELTVVHDRVVVLSLTSVQLSQLNVSQGAKVTIQTEGLCAIGEMTVAEGGEVTFTGRGSLTIAKVTRPADLTKTSLLVTGGSLSASMAESSGRIMHVFPAEGVTKVTVDGAPYAAQQPAENGKYSLWLSSAGTGMVWKGLVQGDTLVITREVAMTGSTTIVQSGAELTVTDPGTYRIAGMHAGTHLNIQAENVTVILADASLSQGGKTLVTAAAPWQLVLEGASVQNGTDTLFSGSACTVSGTGSLDAADIGCGLDMQQGTVKTATVPVQMAPISVPGITSGTAVTLDGAQIGLCYGTDVVYLPLLSDGASYQAALAGQKLNVQTVAAGETAFLLSSSAPSCDVGDAAVFRAEGTGEVLGGRILLSGTTPAVGFLKNVKLSGASLIVPDGKQLTLATAGDCLLDAVQAAPGAALVLECTKGRLSLTNFVPAQSVVLRGNIYASGVNGGDYTQITLTDSAGLPVADRAVTLRAGDKTYDYTTFADGSLYLWGVTGLDGTSVAASDGDTVFTAVVRAGTAAADTGLTIEDLTCAELADGSVRITFTCDGMASAGVQYMLGAGEMPDTYVAQAARAEGLGVVTLTGIPEGAALTYRAYATGTAGAVLTEQSADGFSFSAQQTLQRRQRWNADGASLDAAYTGKTYVSPVEYPEGATAAWTGRHLTQSGQPWQVGTYTLRLTIPEGDPDYLPGVIEAQVKITRAVLTVIPEPNQEKFVGDADPDFLYEVEGLLDEDEVGGVLSRVPGEDVGTYAFDVSTLYAAEWYELRLEEDAYQFTILPASIVISEILHPTRQEIVRKDGRTVAVMLNTKDALTVTHLPIGHVLFDAQTGAECLFSPVLRHNPVTDEVLLQIRAVAELNRDGGYVTNDDGSPVYGGRYFRLSWITLRRLKNMGVDAISVSQRDTQLVLELDDLLTDEFERFIKAQGGTLESARIALRLTPAPAADASLRALNDGWTASALLVLGQEEYPAEALLPGLKLCVDVEDAAEMMAAMDLYDEETFETACALTLLDENGQPQAQQATFVTPFREDELTKADYPQMMFTHRYLLAPLTAPATVLLTRAAT